MPNLHLSCSNRYRVYWLRACALYMVFWTAGVSGSQLRVYSDSSIQLEAVGDVQVVQLDRAQKIEERLEENLPAALEHAEVVVRQRLAQGGPGLQREIGLAYQDITDAWRQGITHLPAVVVDRRYVVYGEPNVQRAVQAIEAFRDGEK